MPIIKKIFIISLFILFASTVFWGVYNFSFNTKKDKKPDSSATSPQTEEKPKTVPQITAISDEAVIAPVISDNGNKIKYYSKTNGKAYETDLDGQNKKILSDKELVGLNNVLWSPDRNKVISVFSSPEGKNSFVYYDYLTKTGSQLSSNVDQVAWQLSGNKIFYKYYDSRKKIATINISNPDGTDWQKLAEVNHQFTSIAQIPKSSSVSFWNRADGFNPTAFESAPTVPGQKKTILAEKYGADFLWSPDGNLALVSTVTDKGSSRLQTATVNFNGGEYKNLEFPTIASKCAWSNDSRTIYCALPGGIPDTAVMPNDYWNRKFSTTDTFWKIDATTGEKNRIIEIDKIGSKLDAINFFLNSDESFLFFINQIDGKLYRISL